MLIISHRGNTEGSDPPLENHPNQIDRCISEHSMNVEVDVRFIDGEWYLGHDSAQYNVSKQWLILRSNFLWLHCKNIEAMCALQNDVLDLHYFWHETDQYTITSKGWIWAYPACDVPFKTRKSIGVMPPPYFNASKFAGICTDDAEVYMRLQSDKSNTNTERRI